jgi:hypothetical protein
MFFCSRILWKSKKDGLKDKEANTDVTSHLAYAIAATIVTVKHENIKVCVIDIRHYQRFFGITGYLNHHCSNSN